MEGTAGITQTRVTHHGPGELGSPPSQNLEVPLLRATGRRTRTTTRAQSRVSQGLARTGARFGERSTFPPRVSGMLIASDVSCSSCRVPCAPAARRLLLRAAGFTVRAACSAEPAGLPCSSSAPQALQQTLCGAGTEVVSIPCLSQPGASLLQLLSWLSAPLSVGSGIAPVSRKARCMPSLSVPTPFEHETLRHASAGPG